MLAIAGRAGDSLDTIGLVVGPPVRAKWTPGTHEVYPTRTRKVIRTVLLANRRADCLWSKIDREKLLVVLGLIAAPPNRAALGRTHNSLSPIG